VIRLEIAGIRRMIMKRAIWSVGFKRTLAAAGARTGSLCQPKVSDMVAGVSVGIFRRSVRRLIEKLANVDLERTNERAAANPSS